MFERRRTANNVVAPFAGGRPWNRSECSLEEGVVYDVALVFPFDDPVAGIGLALPGVGEDGGGVDALRGVYKKRSAGAKSVHETLS